MQKKLLALAVAGLASTGAFAQAADGVQLYGIVDAYAAQLSTSNTAAASVKSFTGVQSGGLSGSRLGVKGTEDLGDGLKALFQLEYSLAVDDNTGVGNARVEMVGLTGGFGTAVAGYLQTPAYDWAVKYQALGGSAVDPQSNVVKTVGINAHTGDRVGNAVAYVSPNMGGVTAKVAYAAVSEAKTVDGTTDKRGAWVLSADYDAGPLSVGAFARIVGDDKATAGEQGINEYGIGAKFNAGVATVFANFQVMNDKDNSAAESHRAFSFGAAVPVTAKGAVVASYAASSAKSAASNDLGASAFTVAYAHSLSKRTTAYAGFANYSADKGNAGTGFGIGVEADESVRGVIAGLRHSF